MNLAVMLKKEMIEFIRTYKLLIVFIVFLLFAIISPLTAKFMPEIMTLVLPKEFADSFPESTAIDSWGQFFKNFSQMGLFVLTILFANSIIHERVEGTLTILLTKGLKRKTVYLAKLLFACCVWTVGYWVAFFVTYFYTSYYWANDQVNDLFIAVSHLWAFGIFLLAIIFLGNVLFKSIFGNLLFVALIVVCLFVLSIFPKADSFNVLLLASNNVNILQEGFVLKDYIWTYVIFVIGIVFCTFIGIEYFKRKDV